MKIRLLKTIKALQVEVLLKIMILLCELKMKSHLKSEIQKQGIHNKQCYEYPENEFWQMNFDYKKIYLSMNSTARTYITGLISFAFLQQRFIRTYEIIPIEIPSEIL